MRNVLKKVKRWLALCLCVALFVTTNQVTSAQENADSDIMQGYLEKVAEGVEVYPLVDEEGVFWGYYEPYSEEDVYNEEDVNAVMPRYTSIIDGWTVEPGTAEVGVNVYTLESGAVIKVSISVSKEGTSYLGLCDTATDTLKYLRSTESTNGWNGTVTLVQWTKSTYSFAIINMSDSAITYTGSYSL